MMDRCVEHAYQLDSPRQTQNRGSPRAQFARQTGPEFPGRRAGLFCADGVGGLEASPSPLGGSTLIAFSGCGSALQLWTAERAAASNSGSNRAVTSSRFLPASVSPCWAASANHL